MKTTIYANHGLPAHEKETVYGTRHGEIYDEITVDIPDAFETVSGELAVELSGMTYLLREVLANANMHGINGSDSPVLRWYDGSNYHTRKLTVIENA
jgi:hypothetical protein